MINPWLSLPNAVPTDARKDLADSLNPAHGSVLIPLPALAVLKLSGPESAKFLQGQTTCDFREIEKGRVLPGAICSLKGRVLFSFIALTVEENILLVLPADQIEDALSHLKKYAVFSKTTLSNASTDIALAGIGGADAEAQIKKLMGNAPAQGQLVSSPDGKWAVRIGNENRYLLGHPAATLAAQWPALQQSFLLAHENQWWAADIRDGLAFVFAPSRDLFQPQELNYAALEGVSYNKGCYTGQEIVARLYFRGKLKQRLYRFEATASDLPAIGSKIMAEGKPVGEVVIAAHSSANKIELLAIAKNQAVQAGQITLEDGSTVLKTLALPYELPAEKEE